MSLSKRKRVSDVDADSSGDEEASSPGDLQLAEVPFEVRVTDHPKKALKNNKKRKTEDWSEVMTENYPTPDSKDAIYYQVSPANWTKIRKYKNFVVQEKQFGAGDYVIVNNGGSADNVKNGEGWVGKVLEIRAIDAGHVFVLIFWLYWQSELPMGSQPYHGENELIMSNFMQIIDAQTVDDMVEVSQLKEGDHEEPPEKGYYWRQTYDHRKNKLSVPRLECKCQKPHNPDTLMIQCDSCHKWQHELCVVDDVLRSKWDVLSKATPLSNGNGATNQPLSPLTPSSITEPSASITVASSASKSTPSKKGGKKAKKSRKSLGKNAQTAREPWEDTLEGMLEKDEAALAKKTDSTDAITGKVIVTNQNDRSGSREKLDAKCLFCQASLAPKNDPSDTDANTIKQDEDSRENSEQIVVDRTKVEAAE